MSSRQQNNHVFREVGSVTAKKTNIYKVTLVVNWINVYHGVVLNCRDFTSFFSVCFAGLWGEGENVGTWVAQN